MASLRSGNRNDGSTYAQVLYRVEGKQSTTSFHDLASATRFQKVVDSFGPAKALGTLGTVPELWLAHRRKAQAETTLPGPPGTARCQLGLALGWCTASMAAVCEAVADFGSSPNPMTMLTIIGWRTWRTGSSNCAR